MAALGIRLADAEAKYQPVIEPGVGKKQLARTIDAIHDLLVDLIPASMAEADQVQRRLDRQLETLIRLDP